MIKDSLHYIEYLEHKHVRCILSIWRKTCLKTRNSVQGNGGFQIHMQFLLLKSNVGTQQIAAPTRESPSVS